MPIACLALAALVAFAFERLVLADGRLPVALATAVAVGLVALDLRVPVFGAVAPDAATPAYAAIRGDGRLLELPVFRPDVHFGSAYLGYARQSPRERPEGYSTVAPRPARRLARELRGLSCGRGSVPPELGVEWVAVHRGLYAAERVLRRRPARPGPRRRSSRRAGGSSRATARSRRTDGSEREGPRVRPLPASRSDDAAESSREARLQLLAAEHPYHGRLDLPLRSSLSGQSLDCRPKVELVPRIRAIHRGLLPVERSGPAASPSCPSPRARPCIRPAT